MQHIQSKSNRNIKRLKSLDRKKVRDKENLFLIEGKKLVDEAYKSGIKIQEIYISQSFYEKYPSYSDKLIAPEKNLISDSLLSSISYLSNPEGIIALAKHPRWNMLDILEKGSPVLILDRVNDPKNAGSILRSAEAFGIACVFLLDGCVDLYNEKAVRGSMGSVFRVPNIKVSKEIFNILKKSFYSVYAMDARGELLQDANTNRSYALVIGNESTGIDKDIQKHVDAVLAIPMQGAVESLNAACAASIALYVLSNKI